MSAFLCVRHHTACIISLHAFNGCERNLAHSLFYSGKRGSGRTGWGSDRDCPRSNNHQELCQVWNLGLSDLKTQTSWPHITLPHVFLLASCITRILCYLSHFDRRTNSRAGVVLPVTFVNFSWTVSIATSNISYMFVNCQTLVWSSLIAQLVKNPPAMQETPVWFLGQEGLLEKE